MKKRKIMLVSLGILLLTIGVAFAQEDAKGAKDHPSLSRMPGYFIYRFNESEFDVYKKFADSKGKPMSVEGRYYYFEYGLKKDVPAKSDAHILRNYINAVTKIGGTVIHQTGSNAYLKFTKDKRTTWVHVNAYRKGVGYYVWIIEEEAMEQYVVADAASMAKDISSQGRVALYGIYFDFDKTDVKPESDPTLKEIAKLLQQNPGLKLYVVGHTDNVGDLNYNMKLSQARADAVVKTLVSQYQVDGNRLKAFGVGPLTPVTSNDTEEGKAKNRRVELVK
jgi:OmpA-OmpF porin, OOP family